MNATTTTPITITNLNDARLAFSAAQRDAFDRPCPETTARLESARTALRAALNALRAKVRPEPRPLGKVCCDRGVEVRDTHYAFECRCPVHGTRTRGTCD